MAKGKCSALNSKEGEFFGHRISLSQSVFCTSVLFCCEPGILWPLTFAYRALQVTRKVDILTPLGALYYNTGRYEEALQVYREATSLQPDSTDIWLALVNRHTHTHTLIEWWNARTSGCVFAATSWTVTKTTSVWPHTFCQILKNLFLLFHTHCISVPGSGFSHGRSSQRGWEDDPWHHIQRRQLYRMLPPPVRNLQQAWQLHRGVCVCVWQ